MTWRRLESHGLVERCLRLESRRATKSELLMVHDEAYIDLIASTSEMRIEEIEEKVCSQFDDVYMNRQTYDCALIAAGCVLQAVDSLFRGDCDNAMALVRPPGFILLTQLNPKPSFCRSCVYIEPAPAPGNGLFLYFI